MAIVRHNAFKWWMASSTVLVVEGWPCFLAMFRVQIVCVLSRSNMDRSNQSGQVLSCFIHAVWSCLMDVRGPTRLAPTWTAAERRNAEEDTRSGGHGSKMYVKNVKMQRCDTLCCHIVSICIMRPPLEVCQLKTRLPVDFAGCFTRAAEWPGNRAKQCVFHCTLPGYAWIMTSSSLYRIALCLLMAKKGHKRQSLCMLYMVSTLKSWIAWFWHQDNKFVAIQRSESDWTQNGIAYSWWQICPSLWQEQRDMKSRTLQFELEKQLKQTQASKASNLVDRVGSQVTVTTMVFFFAVRLTCRTCLFDPVWTTTCTACLCHVCALEWQEQRDALQLEKVQWQELAEKLKLAEATQAVESFRVQLGD